MAAITNPQITITLSNGVSPQPLFPPVKGAIVNGSSKSSSPVLDARTNEAARRASRGSTTPSPSASPQLPLRRVVKPLISEELSQASLLIQKRLGDLNEAIKGAHRLEEDPQKFELESVGISKQIASLIDGKIGKTRNDEQHIQEIQDYNKRMQGKCKEYRRKYESEAEACQDEEWTKYHQITDLEAQMRQCKLQKEYWPLFFRLENLAKAYHPMVDVMRRGRYLSANSLQKIEVADKNWEKFCREIREEFSTEIADWEKANKADLAKSPKQERKE